MLQPAGTMRLPRHRRGACILSADNLELVVPDGDTERRALMQASLRVTAGEIVMLIGPPGSGKSSLLNLLGGLAVPNRGTVSFGETPLDFTDLDAMRTFRREHVGFVFGSYSVVPNLTPFENVSLVARMSVTGMEPMAALDLAGLGEKAHANTSDLHPGEQQRVILARALVKWPDILLCDEPAGRLSQDQAVEFFSQLQKINTALGMTMVITSQNPRLSRFGDRLIRLANGRIVQDAANPCRQPAPTLM